MLPQVRRVFLRALAAAVLSSAALLGGCGERDAPEAQVRAVIAAGEAAAEARDLSGILEHVSSAYHDDQGRGREELGRFVRGYLLMHPSVHVLTRIESVDFPYRDYARVQLTVGTLGREAADASAFDLAGDVHDVVLELQLEDDAWKVVRAAWRPTRRG